MYKYLMYACVVRKKPISEKLLVIILLDLNLE